MLVVFIARKNLLQTIIALNSDLMHETFHVKSVYVRIRIGRLPMFCEEKKEAKKITEN